MSLRTYVYGLEHPKRTAGVVAHPADLMAVVSLCEGNGHNLLLLTLLETVVTKTVTLIDIDHHWTIVASYLTVNASELHGWSLLIVMAWAQAVRFKPQAGFVVFRVGSLARQSKGVIS